MAKRMRDLERLQEQDPDERGRNVATLFLLAGVLVSLLGATWVIWNRASASRADAEPDDLDRLQAVHKVVAPAARAKAGGNTDQQTALDPTKLTFERALTDEERPEVIAALAAAEREEQQLAAAGSPLEARSPRATRAGSARAGQPLAPAAMPASVSASSAADQLARAARHDELIAAALPKHGRQRGTDTTGALGTAGGQGEFSLQVISYDTAAAAESFAASLRHRGHSAFITAGQVDGRGKYFRVRVGPFKTKAAADAYRRSFEEREHMNTIVVRRQDDD